MSDAAWERTSRRFQVLAGIQSEYATELLAYGRYEGLAYYVQSYSNRPRLSALLHTTDGGRLATPVALHWWAQLIRATLAPHRRGIVLGGVRPQDIRIISDQRSSRIMVHDLGMAAVLGVPAGQSGATDHPSIYRAPEPDITQHPSSDVFSLGVLLIRMLSGPLAPPTDDHRDRFDRLRARVEHMQQHDPLVGKPLATLLLKTIDPELTIRPGDASRLLPALDTIGPTPTPTNPPGPHACPSPSHGGARRIGRRLLRP